MERKDRKEDADETGLMLSSIEVAFISSGEVVVSEGKSPMTRPP